MVKDADEVTGAAVMDSAADGSGTDRGFPFDEEQAEAKARVTSSFAPGVLDLGCTGKEVGFARSEEQCLALERRSPGLSGGVGLVVDGVPEVDHQLIFDLTHGDWWPVELGATEESRLVLLEVLVGLFPEQDTGSSSRKA